MPLYRRRGSKCTLPNYIETKQLDQFVEFRIEPKRFAPEGFDLKFIGEPNVLI